MTVPVTAYELITYTYGTKVTFHMRNGQNSQKCENTHFYMSTTGTFIRATNLYKTKPCEIHAVAYVNNYYLRYTYSLQKL